MVIECGRRAAGCGGNQGLRRRVRGPVRQRVRRAARSSSSSGTTEESADRLGVALRELDCDVRVALTHYAPVPDTLVGEPPEIYPFLGSYLLGQAIDSAPTALACTVTRTSAASEAGPRAGSGCATSPIR